MATDFYIKNNILVVKKTVNQVILFYLYFDVLVFTQVPRKTADSESPKWFRTN